MFRAQQRPPGFIGNFTIFSVRYDRRDLWDKVIKTRVFYISLAGKFNGNLSGTCVSVAVGEHLLEYLTSMSVQDVEKEVRCRWKLIQLVNHREKDKGRVEVGCDSHAKGRFSFLNNRRS